jgi:tetratricopeptide (TPR) repeat protein/TolB-like protein
MGTLARVGAIVAVLAAVAPGVSGVPQPAQAAQAAPATQATTATAPTPLPANRILVMPFENVKRDAAIFWLGEASSILLADNLNSLGLSAITRPERQQAFQRLQVPPAAVLTDATVIRIAQVVGATQVIIGSLQRDDAGIVVRARSLALEAGRVQADVTERGPVADLFGIYDRIARRLVPPSTPPAGQTDPERPPVAAFENFIKGLLAETPATALTYLNAALKSHRSYDRVRLALWDVYAEQGDHQRALAAVQPVPASSSWARRARFLAGLSQLTLKKYDDAFFAYQALADQQPTPTVLNNLGVVQMRRGGNPQSGMPTYYFQQAAEADPEDPDYFFNLGYAYWEAKDLAAAMYWLRETVRRNPADGDAHFMLGAALAASGNAPESAREKELARRLSSTYEEWEKRPAAEQVPKGLERIKNNEVELPHARRIDTRITETGQRDQQQLAAFYLDRARRLFEQERDREAIGELDRALYLSPYLADGHLLLGRIHLRNGRVREAIDALKISVWSAPTAEGHSLLAEAYVQAKDAGQARAEAERALALDPSSSEAKRLLDVLKSP